MTVEERFEKIAPYLSDLLIKLDKLSDEDKEELFTRHLGAGADTRWLMNFMMMINSTNKDYNPEELQDWNERQDKALQDEGRAYGIEIESIVKRHILSSLELLFGSKWDREIPKIKAECTKRAIEQDDKNHRLGQNKPDTDGLNV